MKEFLAVGEIINTHGIKGEVKVYPLTDDMKRFKKLKEVLIDGEKRKILSCKLQPNNVVLKIEGIDSIEEANKYRKKLLEIKRENSVKLPKGSYFIADLIGCRVIDEDGKEIGQISDVIKTGSNDVYEVKGKSEVLVPAIKDIVTNIDIENKTVTIKPLEIWQCE
ncbi:ribosome maturation factor RimM [Clostridium botulinum]|uniref:Ribosome maturation factor RimM n=1 Tax=Clostridium botulinum TaxID=1491 RepID=A0A846J6Y7_CLOBO|nr:ribosome maturation factor RimM [Clostridium botulinum]ACA55232.1 16S rRNA processing protein RimM [Clostridium botulinum A3 str. Loch Maree]KEJ01566.1 16S rRNA processing protein RimM [Clostridium botulinum A2B7 92]NFH66718.1 16S rRNA processing protein RimM [Clostridium botulinum]NFJ09669.1 16S rRNA processing protein RimM [Clostridium botulinum]NFK14649.1 16S rRNA processing protein RimM [Clostridium botulinum]